MQNNATQWLMHEPGVHVQGRKIIANVVLIWWTVSSPITHKKPLMVTGVHCCRDSDVVSQVSAGDGPLLPAWNLKKTSYAAI